MPNINKSIKNKSNRNIAEINAVYSFNDFSNVINEIEKYSLLTDDPIHKEFINFFLIYMEQKYKSCAILSTLWVDETERGKGLGKQLVQEFNEETKNVEFKFLFTRNKSRQINSFELIKFYRLQGYEVIYETEFESWLINKEEIDTFNSFFY